MNRTMKHLLLGLSTGATVFAIVVPLIHVVAEAATFAGFELAPWDNPAEIFIFLVTSTLIAVFPWGLWIILTDARGGKMFDEGSEVVAYLLAAMGSFVSMSLLVCTVLQPLYAQFRFVLTPALLIGAVMLIRWRWSKVWEFPTKGGLRSIFEHAFGVESAS